MIASQSFVQRAYLYWPFVAPATILSDEQLPDEDGKTLPSLRELAAQDGRCYLRVQRRLSCGIYQAQVAASADLLKTDPILVILTEEQLSYALPLDVRLEAKSQEQLVARARAHAAAYQPLHASRHAQAAPAGSVLKEQPVELPLTVCEELEVPEEVVKEELELALSGRAAASAKGKGVLRRVQQALLPVVTDSLVWQFHRENRQPAPDQARMRRLKERSQFLVRLARWQKKTCQRVVHTLSFINEAGENVLRLIVDAPRGGLVEEPTPC